MCAGTVVSELYLCSRYRLYVGGQPKSQIAEQWPQVECVEETRALIGGGLFQGYGRKRRKPALYELVGRLSSGYLAGRSRLAEALHVRIDVVLHVERLNDDTCMHTF